MHFMKQKYELFLNRQGSRFTRTPRQMIGLLGWVFTCHRSLSYRCVCNRNLIPICSLALRYMKL